MNITRLTPAQAAKLLHKKPLYRFLAEEMHGMEPGEGVIVPPELLGGSRDINLASMAHRRIKAKHPLLRERVFRAATTDKGIFVGRTA